MRTLPPIFGLLLLGGCIDSGNKGWDFDAGSDPSGAWRVQAWRGVHEGRLGFRCGPDGETKLFVETWDRLRPSAGPLVMQYAFTLDAARRPLAALPAGLGIEAPAPALGEGAATPFLRELAMADALHVVLPGADHLVTASFDVSDAAHAHQWVTGECRARRAERAP